MVDTYFYERLEEENRKLKQDLQEANITIRKLQYEVEMLREEVSYFMRKDSKW